MTEQTLELAFVLPSEAECTGCVDEVGRELARVDGVHAVSPDVARGLLTVRFDEAVLPGRDLETLARRAGAQAHCDEHCPAAVHDHGPLDLSSPLPAESDVRRQMLHIVGMDCADCAGKLQSALRRRPGILDAEVNFGAATLSVSFDSALLGIDDVYSAVGRLGYDTLERREAAARPEKTGSPQAAYGFAFWFHDRRAQLTLLSGAAVVAGFSAQALSVALAPWLFLLAVLSGGFFIARAAAFSVRARQVDMNVLMSLAIAGAVAIGEWSEAGLIVFLFGFGTMLQASTLERTRHAIRSLMSLSPPTASRMHEGAESVVPVEEIVPGDIVLVRPGERLAIDGVVTEGHASANQAPITGEAAPVAKAPGDQVFAGSIIERGSLTVRATAGAADNTIAKIGHLIEQAQAKRAPSQSLVDRFAARYTPVVVAAAAVIAFVPPLFGEPFGVWFYRGLAVLIISCPCALVISTPVSILAALSRATRDGVLIKGGIYLEQVAKVRAVAFDKTGTLTAGKPDVTDVLPLRGMSAESVLSLAAAIERFSEHPLAHAIVRKNEVSGEDMCGSTGETCCRSGDGELSADTGAHDRTVGACSCVSGLQGRGKTAWRVDRFRALPGKGVRAEVEGRLHFVGRPELLGRAAGDPALSAAVERLEREGKTVVVVADERGGLGVIGVSDPVRKGAAGTVQDLRSLGIGQITLLTGDNAVTASVVAGQAGISDVRSGLLPDDKVAAAAELRERHGFVAMIGDGVNDAPALATATVGIAMGAAGTDAALETADIVLMGDDLASIPKTIRLGRKTTRIILQNIVFSIGVKAIFLVLAPLGLVTLWMAVLADMGTSLLVTGNGLRLTRRIRVAANPHSAALDNAACPEGEQPWS